MPNFHHWFLPHPKNNHKPKLLHHSFMLAYIALFVAVQFIFSFGMVANPKVLGLATDITAGDLLAGTNAKRIENGLAPLRLNDKLSQAAAGKASDMFTKNYWAHYAPDGTTPWAFIDEAGYGYKYAGENLARDFAVSSQVVDAWMNSATHRKNILDSRFVDIGFAVVNGTLNNSETTLIVQMFGTPAVGTAIAAAGDSGKALPVYTPSKNEAVLLPAGEVVKKPLFNVSSLTKSMSIGLALMLIVLLYVDALHMFKKKIYRISGNNIAHMFFLAVILAMIYLVKSGAIV